MPTLAAVIVRCPPHRRESDARSRARRQGQSKAGLFRGHRTSDQQVGGSNPSGRANLPATTSRISHLPCDHHKM